MVCANGADVGLLKAARRILSHTRSVSAGNPPLYRLILVGFVIAGIAQIFDDRATESIIAITPGWFDVVFITVEIVSALAMLLSLYLVDANRYHASRLNGSLSLERLGLCFLMTVIAVNVASLVFYYGRPPVTSGTWVTVMFWIWGWFRLRDIRRATRELTR